MKTKLLALFDDNNTQHTNPKTKNTTIIIAILFCIAITSAAYLTTPRGNLWQQRINNLSTNSHNL